MDYLDVVVHIFTPDAREFYRLEQLWGEAPKRSRVAGTARIRTGRNEKAARRRPSHPVELAGLEPATFVTASHDALPAEL